MAGNPRKGTIQMPALELGVSVGIQSMRLAVEKSPATTSSPRKHSRVWLYAQFCVCSMRLSPRVDCQATDACKARTSDRSRILNPKASGGDAQCLAFLSAETGWRINWRTLKAQQSAR